jgi:hypothetical protein
LEKSQAGFEVIHHSLSSGCSMRRRRRKRWIGCTTFTWRWECREGGKKTETT